MEIPLFESVFLDAENRDPVLSQWTKPESHAFFTFPKMLKDADLRHVIVNSVMINTTTIIGIVQVRIQKSITVRCH